MTTWMQQQVGRPVWSKAVGRIQAFAGRITSVHPGSAAWVVRNNHGGKLWHRVFDEVVFLDEKITGDLLKTVLQQYRLELTSEAALQKQIEGILEHLGIEFSREHQLGPKDRIDFLVGGVGLECKIKGGKRAIYSQLERYAEHPIVRELLFVTNVPMGVPADICGKPVKVLNIAMGWM